MIRRAIQEAAAGLAAAAVVVLLTASCSGGAVHARTVATGGLIVTARDSGAIECAPIELAMAESHNDFAQHALDEGNFYDARREAEIAETNARLAIDKSPSGKCASTAGKAPARTVAARTGSSKPGAPRRSGGGIDSDGDGIPDDIDQCPHSPEDFDGFQDEDGCPDPDNDGDGITDALDKCPNEPEDRDGFEDADGCPDPDNDGDGIPDKLDKCPNEPEDKDGFEDADGCPDLDNDKDGIPDSADKCPNEKGDPPDGCPKNYKLVTVTDKAIKLADNIYFDGRTAIIARLSRGVLNEIGQVLKDRPSLKIEIQGHMDNQGNYAINLKLSQKRADAVRAYLIKRGVASDRMVAKGYGENIPIGDNRTSQGRAQNRRIEFVITAR